MMDNLTKDVLAAERAGMSYGQWKALHPKTKPDTKRRATKEDGAKVYRNCRICGARFEIKYPNHIMCSDECRLISERNYNRQYQRLLYRNHILPLFLLKI